MRCQCKLALEEQLVAAPNCPGALPSFGSRTTLFLPLASVFPGLSQIMSKCVHCPEVRMCVTCLVFKTYGYATVGTRAGQHA